MEEEPPTSLDWMNDECAQSSILREQICNNCAAHSTTSVLEYCFCLAGDRSFSPRTVQQFSECTDQQALDAGSQLERKNAHCVTGFPDVHMDFILKSLSGTVDAEQIVPEDNFCTDPDAPLPDDYDPYDYDFTLPCRCLEEAQEPPARARMTDFMFDYFTTEDYIVDALQTGPVTTSMLVTSKMQSYGGGVYYNFEECDDYGSEEVPADCKVQPFIVSEKKHHRLFSLFAFLPGDEGWEGGLHLPQGEQHPGRGGELRGADAEALRHLVRQTGRHHRSLPTRRHYRGVRRGGGKYLNVPCYVKLLPFYILF